MSVTLVVIPDLYLFLLSADSPAQGEDEPLPDYVSGADSLPVDQRLLLHIPPTQLPQVGVLQLS